MIGTAKLFRGCKWINTTENDCAVKEKEQVQMIAEKIEAAEKNKPEKGDEKENNQEIKSSEKKIKYFSDNCEQLEDIENWSCEKGAVIIKELHLKIKVTSCGFGDQ
jgi:hypothetical protein